MDSQPASANLARGECIILISGSSGSGKQVIIQAIKDQVAAYAPDLLWTTVSYTTRTPRDGEVDGEHYHFVDVPTFRDLLAAGAFIEHAEFAGNLYGTPLNPLVHALEQGHVVIGDIDVQGIVQFKDLFPKAACFYLHVPLDELERRLTHERPEQPDVIAARMTEAQREAQMIATLYHPAYIISSKTVFDADGRPTDGGIIMARDFILAKTNFHALNRWGTSPNFRSLIGALNSIILAA